MKQKEKNVKRIAGVFEPGVSERMHRNQGSLKLWITRAGKFAQLSEDASHIALGNHALCAQPTDYSLVC